MKSTEEKMDFIYSKLKEVIGSLEKGDNISLLIHVVHEESDESLDILSTFRGNPKVLFSALITEFENDNGKPIIKELLSNVMRYGNETIFKKQEKVGKLINIKSRGDA